MSRCQNRVRERLSFQPEWDEEYQKWTSGFVGAHKWRVDPLHTVDDLKQEAWFTFNYVEHAYPRCMCPKHFMALFKRAMVNKMHDRSCRYDRRRDSVEAPVSTDIYEVFAGRIGEVTNTGYLAAVLNEAPEELKLVMKLLAEGQIEADPKTKELKPRKNLSQKARDFLNKRGVFNAFAHDPVNEIKQLFA